MQDQKLRVDIIGDASKLTRALNTASGKLDKFGSKVSGIGKRLSIGLTLPLGIAGGAAIKLASDFEESMNKVDVAFKSASGEVKEFAKTTLSQFGIAQGTALDMAALFGDMSTSMGLSVDSAADLSTSLVGLAGDLASFKNMNIEEVTTALNGVFNGETEALKRLGIVMTQANLQHFAMEQGIKKTIKQMTQSEIVLLRYNFVMSKTANAQGDFARTSDGAANQMRIFQESMKELGATFGAVILPAFTKLVSFGNDVLKTLQNLDPVTKKVVLVFAALAASAGPLLYLAGTVIPALAAAFAALTLSSGLIVVAIAAVVAALGATVKYQSLKSSIESLNKEIPILRENYNKLRKEHDLTAESSLGIYRAQRKLLKSELALLKLQQDKEQGAIAKMLGIESDEYLRLSKEISKTEQSIKNFDMSISGLEKQVKSTSEETKDFGKSLKDLKAIELTNLQLKWDLADEAKQFAQDFDEAINQEFAAMDSMSFTDVFNEKVAEAFDPDSVPVMDEFDTAEMDLDAILKTPEHKAFLDKMNKMSEISQAVGGEVANAFNQMGMSLVNSLGLADDGFQGFVKGLIGTITQLIAMMLSSAIAQSIAGATASGTATGPAAVVTTPAFIATAVGGILGAFAAIPKFANGGIVSGPTMGLMGEYPGAKANPEVIAPLDKLKGMMGGGASQNVNVGGEFKINGQDLVVALQRADRNRSRIK